MWGEKGESMTKVFSLNRAGGDWGGGRCGHGERPSAFAGQAVGCSRDSGVRSGLEIKIATGISSGSFTGFFTV